MISDRERRVLADIERRLLAEDPHLAQNLGRHGTECGDEHELRLPRLSQLTGGGAVIGLVAAGLVTMLLGLTTVTLLCLALLVACLAVRKARKDR